MSQPTETTTILDQFLHKSMEYLSSAEAFLKAEVPAFVQELLAWKFYDNLVVFIMSTLCLILFSFISKWLYEKGKEYAEDRYNDPTGYYAAAVIILILLVPTGFSFVSSARELVKLKVAPRVYLLQEVRELMK